jgi:hypothetical protein
MIHVESCLSYAAIVTTRNDEKTASLFEISPKYDRVLGAKEMEGLSIPLHGYLYCMNIIWFNRDAWEQVIVLVMPAILLSSKINGQRLRSSRLLFKVINI